MIGTIILGVVTSGFTFLKVGAYYQEIVKGAIIAAAVVIDVHRQRKKSRQLKGIEPSNHLRHHLNTWV